MLEIRQIDGHWGAVWLFSSNIYVTYVKVKSLSRVQLCDPMDCSLPGSSIHGVFQARTLEWVVISFSNEWKWSCSVMSDSERPHGLQPTRLLHPWGFPSKSTGVGCHCLLQSKVYRHSITISNEVLQTSNDFIEAGVLQTVQDSNHKKGLCKHSMILYI